MKYHSGIHFETNDFKNLSFDEDMEVLLPEIIAIFSDEIDDDCYDDKEEFYRKNPQGDYLIKINKGYDWHIPFFIPLYTIFEPHYIPLYTFLYLSKNQ